MRDKDNPNLREFVQKDGGRSIFFMRTYIFFVFLGMKKICVFGTFAFVVFLQSCAPSRFVQPLEKNEISLGGSLGGPVIDFGAPIPMPISSVEIGYGLDTNFTIFGALHTTAAVFGNLQLDIGGTYQFLEQKNYRPALSVSPSVNFIYDVADKVGKLWPVLDLNAFWNYGDRRNYFYVGFNNYFELSSTTANDQPQPYNWLFNPQIGHIIKGKNQQWELTTEFKFLAPYIDNSYAFIPYKSLLGSRGATGFFIGCRWIIGK